MLAHSIRFQYMRNILSVFIIVFTTYILVTDAHSVTDEKGVKEKVTTDFDNRSENSDVDRRPYHSSINVNYLKNKNANQPYHERTPPKQSILSGPLIHNKIDINKRYRRYLEGAGAVLNVSSTLIEENQEITVTWDHIVYAGPNDWIGAFAADKNLTLFTSPIKFKFTATGSGSKHAKTSGGSGTTTTPPPPPQSGSLKFTLVNYRKPVKFLYITGNLQYPQVVAETQVVSYKFPNRPTGIHLAFGHGGTNMLVYWLAGGEPSRPGMKWGLKPGALTNWVDAKYVSKPYSPEDMCDTNLQPAGRQGWLEPAAHMHVTLSDLPYDTRIYYQIGDSAHGWSLETSFLSKPKPDPERPTTLAAFGDMGNVENDGSGQHSWDFDDQGEIPSKNTTDLIASDNLSEFVLHIGDISYAVGYLAEWDNFFKMIQPVSSTKAWMTAIGNHEQGYSKSFYPGMDSGGECGVAYNAFFPFASQNPTAPFSERQPWYDFVYGNIHFIIMSTEHDYTPGSVQYKWLSYAFTTVDRSVTPWLVFAGHRPMYVDSAFPGDQQVAKQLQGALEDMLIDNHVDVAIWGHFHTYQRTCRLKHGVCASDGVQHMVIGMAGYEHSPLPPTPATFIAKRDATYWGYLRMNFQNSTFGQLSYISDVDGSVIDNYQMNKEDHTMLIARDKKKGMRKN
jgi:acid phosphatase type 7